MTHPAEVSFSPMLHVQWALGNSPWSAQTAQAASICGCIVSTHTLAIGMAGSKREHGISLALFIVLVQKLYTSLPPSVCQLNLVPWHPLQGVWEMWGAHTRMPWELNTCHSVIMMMIIISIVIPTIVLHQALRCGYLPDTCFVFCSFSQFTAFLSIVKKGGGLGGVKHTHLQSHTP